MGEVRNKSVPEPVVGRCHTRPNADCSALMAPILRPLADGDVSPFDHLLRDVRPWMAVDASATVSPWPAVPRSSRWADPGSASCTGWAVRGARPPHLLPLWQAKGSCRCASRLLLRAGTGGGMDGMRAQPS